MEWLHLVLALGVVTLGAEGLVRGATLLALRFGVSPLFVGLTIVGFGTSSPELAASVTATLQGSSDVSVGNALGSSVFNIGVIVGITAVIHPIRIQLHALRGELVVATLAATTPWLSLAFGGTIPRAGGAFLVCLLAAYLVATYRRHRSAKPTEARLAEEEIIDTLAASKPGANWTESFGFQALLVFAGLGLLVGGSSVFVTSAITLARNAGLSELLVGLTVVSVGTSLPELVTSVVAGVRGNPDIAVGNIVGSNIFNMLGILGASAVVRPQVLDPRLLAFDVPVLLLGSVVLVPMIWTRGIISRWEGILLLAGYGGYLIVLVSRGA